MTHVYSEESRHVPVTVLEIVKTVVVGKRTVEKDGYEADIVAKIAKKKVKKSLQGQFKKVENIAGLVEERADHGSLDELTEISTEMISKGDLLTLEAVSKGKGFSGTVKRHGFATGPKTHGSNNYRQPGSIGPTYPQRVIKGRRMAGRMGGEKTTLKDIEVMLVESDKSRIFVKGPVPGANMTPLVLIKK